MDKVRAMLADDTTFQVDVMQAFHSRLRQIKFGVGAGLAGLFLGYAVLIFGSGDVYKACDEAPDRDQCVADDMVMINSVSAGIFAAGAGTALWFTLVPSSKGRAVYREVRRRADQKADRLGSVSIRPVLGMGASGAGRAGLIAQLRF